MVNALKTAFFVVGVALLTAFPNLGYCEHTTPPTRTERLLAPPQPGNGFYYASEWDVGRCALLAESIAVLGWYATPLLEKLGTGLQYSTVKLSVILKSEKAAKALLAILGVVGIKESSVLDWTLGQLWDYVIAPQIEACKRVGYEFFDAARSLPTLFSRPDFYIARASDTIGIRNGRFCAEPIWDMVPGTGLGAA